MPPMFALSIRILGLTTAINQLSSLAAGIQDWNGYWEVVEEFLDKRAEQAFNTEGASHGQPWEPLSPAYAIRKARDGYGTQKILVRTGAMKAGLLGSGDLSHTIRRRSRRRFTWGSSDPLVAIHHEGKGDWLPARPILVLTESDVKALSKEARNFINRKAVEAGMAAFTSFTRRGFSVSQLRSPAGRFVS